MLQSIYVTEGSRPILRPPSECQSAAWNDAMLWQGSIIGELLGAGHQQALLNVMRLGWVMLMKFFPFKVARAQEVPH